MLVRLTPAHPIEAFKKADELLGKYLGADSGIDFISLRFASIYGPRYRTLRHLPAQLVHAAIRGSAAPLNIPGLPPFYSGDHATDLCYAPDCARGIRLVHTSDRLRHTSYNIGTGRNLTNQDVANAAKSVFPGLEVRLEPGVGPDNWPNATLDVTRAKEDTGYESRFTLEEALDDYAAWLRDGHSH
jgi:UDP-glucose 4-epimerase